MKITVFRYNDTGEETLSLIMINNIFECYGLEDEMRTEKVFGETRIPEGTYRIKLRTEGGFHQRYSKRFKDFHEGMLHVDGVPNFEYILIHIGNSDDDTAGCLLTGKQPSQDNKKLINSTDAYIDLYKKVLKALKDQEPVHITYTRIYNNEN